MVDPPDDHFSDELMETLAALRDKDLRPLARYMRSGGLAESPPGTVAIPDWLACELAEIIEENRLKATGKKWSAEVKQRTHDYMVGRFIEREMKRLGPGSYEAAVAAASRRFDRVASSLADGLRRYRRRQNEY